MSSEPSPPYPSYPSRSPYPPPRRPDLTYPWQPPPAPPGPESHRAPAPAPQPAHRELRVLRGAYRRQRRTASLTALGYFVLFLALSAFAPDLMTTTVVDRLPAGLLLALLQLPVTWLAVGLYERTARRRVDPVADRIRRQSEPAARGETAR
jgi:uncharacterized membrane protein (DUF485 family)